MQIVPLDQVPLEELVAAFNDAFSDYAVTIEMTAEKLSNVILARSVRLDRSQGVMQDDRLGKLKAAGKSVQEAGGRQTPFRIPFKA
jgi:hypothetical protein